MYCLPKFCRYSEGSRRCEAVRVSGKQGTDNQNANPQNQEVSTFQGRMKTYKIVFLIYMKLIIISSYLPIFACKSSFSNNGRMCVSSLRLESTEKNSS